MQRSDTERGSPIISAPFVTARGRRLPVRTLSYAELPLLIEFSDYLARRVPSPEIVGFDRAALENMTEPGFNALTLIAIFAGPNPLIRAVAAYVPTSATKATVRFTVDDSLLPDGVFRELIHRVADHARRHNATEIQAPGSTSIEREAFEASGLAFAPNPDGGGGLTVDVHGPPVPEATGSGAQ